MATLSTCAETVRKNDRDRYLTCLFAPEAARERLFALYALNFEIARTAEVVSEPMLGEIRLQWWREAIEGIFTGEPRRHDVVLALAKALKETPMTREHFDRLIDARAFDLLDRPPVDLAELESYVADTSARLTLLALEALRAAGPVINAPAREVGIAWGLIGLIRSLPFHASAKRIYLPASLMEETKVRPAELFELRSSAGLRKATMVIADKARSHLRLARQQRRYLSRIALPAMLPGVLANHYLQRLLSANYDPFDSKVQEQPPSLIWKLAWARLCNRY